MTNNQLSTSFKSWKIWLALIFGLSFTFYLLWTSLNETHFIEVDKPTGTHIWKDSNGNKLVDKSLISEFLPQKGGDYRKKTSLDFISEIKLSYTSCLYLMLAFLFVVGRDLAYIWRIRILTNKQLSWKKSVNVILLWEFASALSPGVVGGSAVAMFILNREKISLGKSTSIVVVTAMMDNLFYVLMIPLVFFFISPTDLFPLNNTSSKNVEYLFWFGFVVIFTMCLFLFLSIFYFPYLIKNTLSLLFSISFLKKWKEKAIKTGDEIVITSNELKSENWLFWLKTLLSTILSWTSRYLVINCVLAAFVTIGFYEHFFILGKQLVLWLFMLISPTPGASGVAEYAFSELMVGFGNSAFIITTAAIIWRLFSYFPYLIIGSIILPKWIKNTND
jgi:glycosyltransferase 2 family protein